MKQVVILFGPPGAGKGTQSELLSTKTGLYLFETSRILEREFEEAKNLSEDAPERFIEFDGQKFDILNEKKLWKEGALCSPPFVTYLVIQEIKKLNEEGKNLILAGSPRTIYEAEKIIPFVEGLYGKENIKPILIEISPEETTRRNTNRRICELVRHSILFNEETKLLSMCPLDGSKLIKREGLDDPKTIVVRLQQYKERTFPIFNYFKENGFQIKTINGEQSVSDVYDEIAKALGN